MWFDINHKYSNLSVRAKKQAVMESNKKTVGGKLGSSLSELTSDVAKFFCNFHFWINFNYVIQLLVTATNTHSLTEQ